jgi:Putative MetA-pathway of phenol degradation
MPALRCGHFPSPVKIIDAIGQIERIIRRPTKAATLVFFSLVAAAAKSLAAPITFNTALPVPKSEFIVREQFVVDQSGHDPSAAGRDRTAWSLISVLGYGVTGKLAVFGVLPYSDNDLTLSAGGRRLTRRASGIGDLTLFGRYTVFQRDQPGRTFRIAPFLGVKIPTSNGDKRDALGRLPASIQTSTGAWGGVGGVVATYQTLDYEFDAQVNYRLNGRAKGFEAGDVVRLDGSLQYRVWPPALNSAMPGFLYAVIETNLIHQDKNRFQGVDNPNSGGISFFLTPGIQYVTRRWVLETAVQLPLVQALNGTALERDYIVRAGFRFNF